jgi:ATP-dependent Lon protease
VLEIGGLKEKLLAALRAGIKEAIIPKDNEKDLRDMPQVIIDKIKIHPVKFVDEVFALALKGKPAKTKNKRKKAESLKTAKEINPKNLQ